MTNRFPLIVNASANQIQELASGDNLDLTGSNISNVGNITAYYNINANTFYGSGAGLTSIPAANISGSVPVAVNVSGNAQPNITSVGTLASLSVTSTITGNISGSAGSATTSGTVTTNAQPNITSTGTLVTLYATQYVETKTSPSISSNTLTLDLSTCNLFDVSLNANVTTLTITNAPTTGRAYGFTLKLNITGSYTVTWGLSVHWPGGTAPTLTTTSGKVDVFEFLTIDAGTTWYAFVAGQNL
jgi:hypothetical protein